MTETEEDGEEGMRRPASMAAFAEEMKWGQGIAIWVVGKRIEVEAFSQRRWSRWGIVF